MMPSAEVDLIEVGQRGQRLLALLGPACEVVAQLDVGGGAAIDGAGQVAQPGHGRPQPP